MTKQTQKNTTEEKFEVPPTKNVNTELIPQKTFDEFHSYWFSTPIEKTDTKKIDKLIGKTLPENLRSMLKDEKAFRSMPEYNSKGQKNSCYDMFYKPVLDLLKASKVVKPKVEAVKPAKPVKASKVASKATSKPDKVKTSKPVKIAKVEMF